MRTQVLVALSFAALATMPSQAAIKYAFHQTTRSEIREIPSGEISGRMFIDGDHARVDFDGKTGYGEGSYILSFSPTQRMVIVDPIKQTTSEVNMANVANALAATKIAIANLHKDFKTLPDHLQIAGVPTDHYRLEASYDMTVMFGDMPITQHVRTVVEKWTTTAFGDIEDSMTSNMLKSGNPQLDELIDNETRGMKGLPMRQVVTVITGPGATTRRVSDAQLNVTTRKQQLEMVVSDVQMVPSDASLFVIPASYKKLDSSKADEPIHNLTLSQ